MPALKAHQTYVNHVVDEAWCPGCGLHHAVTGEHRPDCTSEPAPLLCADCGDIRLPSERGHGQPWRYNPATDTYHCPNPPERHEMSPTPAQLAMADQELATASGHLDLLIGSYAIAATTADHTQSIARLMMILKSPVRSDGTSVSHEAHVCKLALTLAIAIDRLARA